MWGLALEGGGAKGAFQIGAYKALRENGYEFGGITGTSIGSLNAAMLVQGDYDKLVEIWEDLDPEAIFGKGVQSALMEQAFSLDSISNYTGELKDLVLQGGIDVGPINEYLSKYIDEQRVRDSHMDFGLVTYNLTERKAEKLFIEDIPEGALIGYLLASSYLPVFKPTQIGGKYFLDGGFVDKLPFRMLIDKGYKKLVLIRIGGFGFGGKATGEDIEFLEINPRRDLGNILDFNRENSRRLIQMGYMDTLVTLGVCYGHNYTLRGEPKTIAEQLFDLEDPAIGKICEILGLPALHGKDRLYMYGLPKLAEFLGLKDKPDSGQIAVEMLEVGMELMNMDSLKIYPVEEALNQVLDAYASSNGKSVENTSQPFQRILNLISKRDQLDQICEILFKKGSSAPEKISQ